MPVEFPSIADIPWEVMDTMISGKSAIDVPRLYCRSLADARDFLSAYGFEWDNQEDRAELESLRVESLEFIDSLLQDEPDLRVLQVVRDEEDVRKILLWASAPVGGARQYWACILLRVMHTFAHCGSYFQQMFSNEIRDQVLGRFQSHVFQNGDALSLGSGPDSIPLYAFEVRGTKSRNSLALKLLQKAENVGADIFDWVGIRFVTNNRFDALLVAKYLRVQNLILFSSIRPGRSRNTLIDVERLRQDMAVVDDQIRAGKLASHEKLSKLRDIVREYPYPEPGTRSANPFSLSTYHSIQFTVTQQIRVANPYLGSVGSVISAVDKRAHTGAQFLTRALSKVGMSSEVKFFFPYEVQILDKASFVESRSGRAAHNVYKQRQRLAVKQRIFGKRVIQQTGSSLTVDDEPIDRDAG